MDRLDPSIIVQEPGSAPPSDDPWVQQLLPVRFRTCDSCHSALSLPAGLVGGSSATSTSPNSPGVSGVPSILSAGAFFPASPSLGGGSSASPSEAGASDVSDLTECPVCGTHLAGLGSRELQENHVKECLETGGGSIVDSGRYLVFKLPPGPLGGCLVSLSRCEECR